MRLESALQNSRSGIDSHGKAITVVGDNISNVSTYGYKKSRAEFSDIIAEGQGNHRTMPESQDGGEGVRVSKIRQIHTQGFVEQTDRGLDVSIGGNGYYMIGDVENPSYTRSGIFEINDEGVLVTSAGDQVLGLGPLEFGAEEPVDGQFIADADLQQIVYDPASTEARATNQVKLGGNLSSTSALGEVPANPEDFNDVTAGAGLSYSLRVFDSLGEEHTLTVAAYRTGEGAWTVQPYINAADLGGEDGTPQAVGNALNLTFDGNGALTDPDQAIQTLDLAYSNGADAGAIALDLGEMTQLATNVSAITSVIGDGTPPGSISSVDVNAQGVILGQLSSGVTVEIGRMALAKFVNDDGLVREGDTYFRAGIDAGERIVSNPGLNGFGTLRSGSLERSNVDLSQEFTDLVVFQRGYQANSQTFSTASTLIEQTIQLIR